MKAGVRYYRGWPRRCDKCGGSYHRRNLQEIWFFDSELKLWIKKIVKVCVKKCSETKGIEYVSRELSTPPWGDETKIGRVLHMYRANGSRDRFVGTRVESGESGKAK